MSENVPFFDNLHTKLAESANMTPKLVVNKSIQCIKIAKLYADTTLFAMGFLKSYGKSYRHNTTRDFLDFALFAQGFVATTIFVIFF